MRKRHVQQSLRFRDKNGQLRGGKRIPGKGKRLGRPPKGSRSSERHERRDVFNANEPVHVTCRVVADVAPLRRRHLYKAVRRAMQAMLTRESCRIVHVSVQGTHVHLLVEAQHRMALARGMQGLQISAAKHINGAITWRSGTKRRGKVFGDRYHAEVIKSRRQARHALAYVLNNWRRHREDGGRAVIDAFSSGASFDGWSERQRVAAWKQPPDLEPLPVRAPRTWLLREGWRMYGLIGVHEVPGPIPARRAA